MLLQTGGLDSALYIFLGIVHNVYLPSIISSQGNRTCNDKIIELGNAMDRCYINETGHSEFDMNVYGRNSIPYQMVLKRCSVKPHLDDCLDSSISVYQDCLNSTHRNGIEVWKKIDKEVAAYVCNDNAQIAKDLFEKSEDSCWNTGITGVLRKCLLNYTNPLPLYDIQGIGKQCSQLDDLEFCFEKNELSNCYQNISTKIMKKIMGTLKSHLCKNN